MNKEMLMLERNNWEHREQINAHTLKEISNLYYSKDSDPLIEKFYFEHVTDYFEIQFNLWLVVRSSWYESDRCHEMSRTISRTLRKRILEEVQSGVSNDGAELDELLQLAKAKYCLEEDAEKRVNEWPVSYSKF